MKIRDISTVELDLTFTEPSVNSDGSPLLDLAFSTIYLVTPDAKLKVLAIPASGVAGGKVQNAPVVVNAPAGQKTDLLFEVTSTDVAGNESLPDVAILITVDRIAPAAPLGFTVA